VVRDFWIHSTVLINNEWGERGTGFLVGDKNNKRIFLVTNKHVINEEKSKGDNVTRLVLYFNMERKQDGITRQDIEVSLQKEKNHGRNIPTMT
jgi:hypothetical protein